MTNLPANQYQRTVLLLGNYRPAVALARSLSACGFRIMLGSEGEAVGASRSKDVDVVWDHPLLSDGELGFLAALRALLDQRSDIYAIMPVAENFVTFLAAHEDELRARVLLASPRQDIVDKFLSKLDALSFAQECGVATLPFENVSNMADLYNAATRIGYPLTIRPHGTGKRLLDDKKALILKTETNLRDSMPAWPAGHETLLLQGFAHGRRHNIYFAAAQGQFLGLVESKIARTDHPEGTGLAVEGETIKPTPALVEDTQKLIARTNYTGIGLAQFIVDPKTGQHCFLELNPRVGGSHAVAEQAGLPLGELAVRLAGHIGSDVAQDAEPWSSVPNVTPFKIRTGLRYAWTGGDLLGAKLALMRDEISLTDTALWALRASWTALRADIHMVWSWRDPHPALQSLNHLLPRKVRMSSLPGRAPAHFETTVMNRVAELQR